MIRLATLEDIPTILAISNHYALTTPANFAVEPESLDSWQAEFRAKSEVFPWFVAELDEPVRETTPTASTNDLTRPLALSLRGRGKVIGFAKASPWKGRCAYDWSAETTVYIDSAHLGRGIGRALYDRLISTLRAQGYRTLLGGITLPNEASMQLHESFGFRRVAALERIGWKFGRWHDVGYWQLQLQPHDHPPSKVRPVREVVEVSAAPVR